MKLLFTLLMASATAQAATVNFALTNFASTSLPSNTVIKLFYTNQPTIAGAWIATGKPIRINAPYGVVSTNLQPGDYSMTVEDITWPRPLRFSVGAGAEYNLSEIATNASVATSTGPFVIGITNTDGTVSITPSNGKGIVTISATGGGGPTNGITSLQATNIAASIAADTNAALLTTINMASNTVLTAALQGIVNASKSSSTLVVDAENGSDATGLRGREDRPYASISAATAASAPGDVILVRPGSNYVASTVWLKTNVTVRGFGPGSKIYGAAAQTSQAVLAITNSGVTIEDVWVSAAGTAIGYIGGHGNLAYATNVTLRNVQAYGGAYGIAWAGDSIGDGNGHSLALLMDSCVVDASTNGIGVRILGYTNSATVRMVNCHATGAWDAVILGGCVAVIDGGRYIATQIDGITTGNYADVTVRNAYVRGGPVANYDLYNDGHPTSILREDGVDYRTPELGDDDYKITHVPRQIVQSGEVRTGSIVVSNGIAASSMGSGIANSTTVLYGDRVWRAAPSGAIGFAPQYGTENGTNWAQISTNIITDLRQEIADTTLDFVPQYGSANLTNLSAYSANSFLTWTNTNPGDPADPDIVRMQPIIGGDVVAGGWIDFWKTTEEWHVGQIVHAPEFIGSVSAANLTGTIDPARLPAGIAGGATLSNTIPSTVSHLETNIWLNASAASFFDVTLTNNAVLQLTNAVDAGFASGEPRTVRVKRDGLGLWQLYPSSSMKCGQDITGFNIGPGVTNAAWISLRWYAPSNRWEVVGNVSGF